jgi:lipopolysaccharide/colanic/teichoic acid biosynthesis glycosyltransferase
MYKHFLKRVFDIVLGLLALPVVVLLVLIIGPIIFFNDQGPVFYNGERLGRNGKMFKMFKFRSMYVNSPDIRLESGATFNSDDDPRVTPVGKFLRKTSIDEIPQFLNVLIGDMSFVGPRPDTPDFLDVYVKENPNILTIRPGITGYNQAYYRNSISGEEKRKNDSYYTDHLTLWLDVKIVFKTISSVILRKNINRE